MKYVIGSIIISFGILVVGLIILTAIQVKAPSNALEYFGLAWVILAVLSYPLARKLVR